MDVVKLLAWNCWLFRRNFPTAANIERKRREQQERLERGECIENKEFG